MPKNERTWLSVTGTSLSDLKITYCKSQKTASSKTEVEAPVNVNFINFQISACLLTNSVIFSLNVFLFSAVIASSVYTDEAITAENKNTFKENITEFVNKHAEIWKFIKFTFTGASTSVLELAVFWLLQYVIFKSLNEVPVTDNQVLSFLGIEYKGYMYSYFISAVIGYAAAYVMNRKLTFKADANPVLSTILYIIMVVCTIAFNTWFGSFLGTLIKNSGHDSVFIVLLTKLIVMTVPTLWTYPLNRFVIHRKKKAWFWVAIFNIINL